jgi:hypothetical protein
MLKNATIVLKLERMRNGERERGSEQQIKIVKNIKR